MREKVVDLSLKQEIHGKKGNIASTIHQLQQDISGYQINDLPVVLSLLIDELKSLLPLLSTEKQNLFGQIFQLLTTSLECQDFLLFSDVLEFELLRILRDL